MEVNVDQSCPSCGTGIHDEAELEAVTGTGMLREITANWECPGCGVAYDQTFPVDMETIEQSGFESWVGNVGDDPLCLVVKEHRGADVVEDKGSSVREDRTGQSGRN